MEYPDPEEILKLARGFMGARILLTGAELNLFTLLQNRPMTAQEVAEQLGMALRPLVILLDALTALALLKKEGGLYYCVPPVSRFLAEDAPDSVLPMVLHMAHLWPRWAGLTNMVQGVPSVRDQDSDAKSEAELRAFIGAMHVVGKNWSEEIVAGIQPEHARNLLDVGGASGTYTIAFLRAVPEMHATLFDQPAVMGMARERLSHEGLLARVTLIPGDFYRDDLPSGHDLVFISAIIHQNNPIQNLDLYQKVFRALISGGRVVIRDHIMDVNRTEPQEGAIFAVNMLVGSDGGATYTFGEIKTGLEQAGFQRISLLRRGKHMDSLVEAFKP